jgi:hypothetical protein
MLKTTSITTIFLLIFSICQTDFLNAADRFFKTGATTWNSANNWSATGSGGGDNAGVPTDADDVYLDATSGNLTIDVAGVCRSINCTGYTGTITHNALTLTIGDGTAGAGNIALKFVPGMTYTLADNRLRCCYLFLPLRQCKQSIGVAKRQAMSLLMLRVMALGNT